MKKTILIILIIIIICIAGVLIILNQAKTETNIKKIKIATTIFPLYDIAKNIGKDKIDIINLLPPGSSPHTFDITPSLIKDLQGTNLVFRIGDPLDGWILDITDSIENIKIQNVKNKITQKPFEFKHDDEHDEKDHETEELLLDPHYWLSTENTKTIAANIAEELIKLDPDNKEFYQKNLNAYQAELDLLEKEIFAELKNLKKREMIVFHESWNYFARQFDLKIVGVFTPNPGQEPTPKYLQSLHETALQNKIKNVFSEPQLSPETLRPFVEDLGLKMHILDPLGGGAGRDSYTATMIYNARVIKQALNE